MRNYHTQSVLHKSEKIERGIRKTRGKERLRLRAKQIYSWNGMSIWRFFPYTWYWYCALTIIIIICCVCLCTLGVYIVCCCNVLGVWPCCGLFCLAFLFSCVSCCRSAEINLYIGLLHTVQREKYSSFDSVRKELIIYEVQQKPFSNRALTQIISQKVSTIRKKGTQTRNWSKNGVR